MIKTILQNENICSLIEDFCDQKSNKIHTTLLYLHLFSSAIWRLWFYNKSIWNSIFPLVSLEQRDTLCHIVFSKNKKKNIKKRWFWLSGWILKLLCTIFWDTLYLSDLLGWTTWPTYLSYLPDLPTEPTYLTYLQDLPTWPTHI